MYVATTPPSFKKIQRRKREKINCQFCFLCSCWRHRNRKNTDVFLWARADYLCACNGKTISYYREQNSTPWPHFGLKYPIETSLQSCISARISYLILAEIQLWNDVSIGYFSPKCGHGVELCSLPWGNSMKPCSSFEGKTYLFADSAIEFSKVEAWMKMTKVGNKARFEASKL